MAVKITVLAENNSGTAEGMLGEHGLSLLIEAAGRRILFDTGQGPTVIGNNALRLGINLADIDAVVISHGHCDHAGGLAHVLGLSRRELPVHVHPLLFEHKFLAEKAADGGEILKDIGVRFTRGYLESLGARFVEKTEAHEIFPGVLLTGQIPRVNAFEDTPTMLRVRRDGALIHDDILDEHSIVIRTDNGLVLLLGCCHPGLINTIEYAMELTGETRFAAIIGGTHLMFHSDERLQQTIDALGRFDFRLIGTSHCTGSRANALIRAQFPDRFIECSSGTIVTLD
ncbi:MAG: MBL fold metallo-hydrolase [Pleurocapsa minor GSE-CHR-MK-17-07R]|jgi:7,8-dihydropterin-6-yl-methyl-4-(beta-D-ribofuranosyl)aminobenzene 5'-phosphate synthase|nr:MBL fold metallo-hydrolase [Pleurocapsa minor GSE-CHR-MK 17-07R]